MERTKGESNSNPTDDSVVVSDYSADADLAAFFYLIVTCSQATSVHDEQGALVLFNPSCTSLLGYERGELSAMAAPNVVHPDDAEVLERATAAASTSPHGRADARVRLIRKNGDEVSVELDMSIAAVSGRRFLVVVSTPVHTAYAADTTTWAHAFG